MRIISGAENKKRGCKYCKDMKIAKKAAVEDDELLSFAKRKWERMNLCPHKKCPYKELDKYETYGDYLKSEDAKTNFVLNGAVHKAN